jgi:hypothetical protein
MMFNNIKRGFSALIVAGSTIIASVGVTTPVAAQVTHQNFYVHAGAAGCRGTAKQNHEGCASRHVLPLRGSTAPSR